MGKMPSRLSRPVIASTPASIEDVAPERSGAGVADESRRQHQTDAAAGSNELKGALDEELIEIGVRGALDTVDAGLANEVSETTGVHFPTGSSRLVAAVAADHVPRRVADHRVEPRSRPGLAALVEEHFRERQRPVMKPEARCRLVAFSEQPSNRCAPARRSAHR